MKLKKVYKKYFLICLFLTLIPSSYYIKNIKIKAQTDLNKNINFSEKDNSILLEKIKKGEDFLIKINLNGKVKEIPISEYLIGVTAAEGGLSAPKEALKVQMVSALNYAIRKFGLNNMFFSGNSYQCYIEKEERIKRYGKQKEQEIENLNFIPPVMLYNGEVVETLHDTCFPGISRGNHEAWFDNDKRFQKEYLPSVYSPELDFYNEFNNSKDKEEFFKKYGEGSRFAVNLLKNKLKMQYKYNINDVFEKIKKNYKDAKMPENVENTIKIISKFSTGYVNDVEIFGVKLKGGDLRRILKMNSSCFTVEILKDQNEIAFECVGNGHGVGISQLGAMIYALKGLNYKQILTHYFSEPKNSNKISFKELKDLDSKLLFK